MTAARIQCAVLGLGRLGYYHAKNLLTEVRGAAIVQVIDPLPGRAKDVAQTFGVASYSDDVLDAFSNPAVDAVVIVTPTRTHAEMIKLAASYGKDVFVEKPLTLQLEESIDVTKAVEEAGIICQVGFMRRFDPAYADAKRRIAAGEIGKPLYYKGFTRDAGAPPPEFIKDSGGLFVDCSIHDYDIARYLVGAEITAISGHGRVLKYPFMEAYGDVDHALSYFEFDNGAAGDAEASRNSPYGYDIRAEIIGSEGSLFIGELRDKSLTILNATGSRYEIIPDFQTRFHDAYRLELQHFIDCVRSRNTPIVTAEDATINLKIALAATESMRSGKKVVLQPQASL